MKKFKLERLGLFALVLVICSLLTAWILNQKDVFLTYQKDGRLILKNITQNESIIIDEAAEIVSYPVSGNGNFVAYSKSNGSLIECYLYDVKNDKKIKIIENKGYIKQIRFVPHKNQAIFLKETFDEVDDMVDEEAWLVDFEKIDQISLNKLFSYKELELAEKQDYLNLNYSRNVFELKFVKEKSALVFYKKNIRIAPLSGIEKSIFEVYDLKNKKIERLEDKLGIDDIIVDVFNLEKGKIAVLVDSEMRLLEDDRFLVRNDLIIFDKNFNQERVIFKGVSMLKEGFSLLDVSLEKDKIVLLLGQGVGGRLNENYSVKLISKKDDSAAIDLTDNMQIARNIPLGGGLIYNNKVYFRQNLSVNNFYQALSSHDLKEGEIYQLEIFEGGFDAVAPFYISDAGISHLGKITGNYHDKRRFLERQKLEGK